MSEYLHITYFIYCKSRNFGVHLIRAYSCEVSQRVRIKSHGIFPLHLIITTVFAHVAYSEV